jgi:murein DD-endopeptidase MepM/ murein hydrolase activator NlpD
MSVRLFSSKPLFAVLLAGLFIGIGGGWGMHALFTPTVLNAQTTEALQRQIDVASTEIQRLQKEISALQSQLVTTAAEKATLQKAISELNLQIKKLQTEISLTQSKINQKDSQIKLLAGTIATTTTAVERTRESAAQSLRILDTLDHQPLVLQILNGGSLSSFFDAAVRITNVYVALQDHVRELSRLKNNLESTKAVTEAARAQLANLHNELGSQQKGLVGARSTQNQLLTTTKSKEANYQALIAQKKKEQAAFQEALNRYESQLKSVGAGEVPTPGALLSWPVKNVTVTQYFGNTPFASANPQVYNGSGHTGIDLAAAPGTPILAADDGVVVATGNTDEVCPYASFGKWVFIKHPTGLGTLYAHLSTIGTSAGTSVSRGSTVGYSGSTGYATGPHLHFGVYVASAVVIQRLPTAVRCPFLIPIAPRSAYLNPISYLPAR